MSVALPARPRPLICLVTDRRIWSDAARPAAPVGGPDAPASSETRAILDLVSAACRAGIDLVQVRERDLPARDLLGLVVGCVEIARGTDTLIVVNERADVALAGGADGVHLRASSLAASALRGVVPARFLIGRSVHSTADVLAGAAAGADYLVAGTVFPSRSKAPGTPVLGRTGLEAIVGVSPVPVLAIGGVTAATAATVAASGAAGLAGIDLFGEALRTEGTLLGLAGRLRAAFLAGR